MRRVIAKSVVPSYAEYSRNNHSTGVTHRNLSNYGAASFLSAKYSTLFIQPLAGVLREHRSSSAEFVAERVRGERKAAPKSGDTGI